MVVADAKAPCARATRRL